MRLPGGVDVLLVVWWVRLRVGSNIALIICMEPKDYATLDDTVIGEDMLARAHELATEFMNASGM